MLLYPISHVIDLLEYRDLRFHGSLINFPIRNPTGSVR